MAGTLLSWLRRTVIGLFEKAVDNSLDNNENQPTDFEILGDPKHPSSLRCDGAMPSVRRAKITTTRNNHGRPLRGIAKATFTR